MTLHELKLTGRLPSPSGVGLAVLRLAQDERSSLDDLAAVIETDPSLTGRLIRLANSSVAAGVREVATAREAVGRLGQRTTTSVCLGFNLLTSNRDGRCAGFDYDRYWAQSLATAVATSLLARRFAARFSPAPAPGELFTLGLVGDIGFLALASVHASAYADLLQQHGSTDRSRLIEAERAQFATDQRALTGAMLRDWRLPEAFARAAEASEEDVLANPRSDPTARLLANARRFAPALVLQEGTSDAVVRSRLAALRTCAARLELDEATLGQVWAELCVQYREWARLLDLGIRPLAGLERLLSAPLDDGPPAPAREPALERPSARAPAAPVAPAPSCLTILVVSSDPEVRAFFARHLEPHGHALLHAGSVREGLERALVHGPQLIACDSRSNPPDALTLARSLRQSAEGQRLHLVSLVQRSQALAPGGASVDAFDAGFDEIWGVPLDHREVCSRVRAVARTVALDRELEKQRSEIESQVAQLAVLTRKLEAASLTDALTDLPNRRCAMLHMEREFETARQSGRPLSLLVADIDRFKAVNDLHGHEAGDRVLQAAAKVLRKSLRRVDQVYRLGGEEFVVLCPGADQTVAVRVAERLRSNLEQEPIALREGTLQVTISVGVATLQPGDKTPEDTLRRADQRLYAAKSAGRNRCAA
jgi:diguanylate cyclase (GGDEF)-like protein